MELKIDNKNLSDFQKKLVRIYGKYRDAKEKPAYFVHVEEILKIDKILV